MVLMKELAIMKRQNKFYHLEGYRVEEARALDESTLASCDGLDVYGGLYF